MLELHRLIIRTWHTAWRPEQQQHNPGGTINKNNTSLASITMIVPEMGWLKIVKIPIHELDEVMGDNDEYIYK